MTTNESAMDRAVTRRMMLNDIQRLRNQEAELLNKADETRKKARMTRNEADAIAKKLAAFDRG